LVSRACVQSRFSKSRPNVMTADVVMANIMVPKNVGKLVLQFFFEKFVAKPYSMCT
jgi:hypothetical protein